MARPSATPGDVSEIAVVNGKQLSLFISTSGLRATSISSAGDVSEDFFCKTKTRSAKTNTKISLISPRGVSRPRPRPENNFPDIGCRKQALCGVAKD